MAQMDDEKKSWQAINHPAKPAGEEPSLPLVDCLTDREYGARGHGKDWREEHNQGKLGLDGHPQRRTVAAILRVMGPLKRAWEYPMLLDRIRSQGHVAFLTAQLPLAAPGTIANPTFGQDDIGKQIQSVTADLEKINAQQEREASADHLLDALKTLNLALYKLVKDCK